MRNTIQKMKNGESEMRKKSNHHKKYYFPDKLIKQLDQIPDYPLTIVEAPSGFGKTTAVREYLKGNLPDGACEYWYTCLGGPASVSWQGFCEVFAKVDEKTAEDLKNLNLPARDTLFYMASYLKDVSCQSETYFVVDNFQLFDCEFPHKLGTAFFMHGNPNLHIIIITQQMKAGQKVSLYNSDVHMIDAPYFFFDRESTDIVLRMEGIQLNQEELEKIYENTEGWVSAIRLQAINLIETGSFSFNANIEQLVETSIWNKLDPEEQDFLMSVSVLGSFTAHQAAIMLGQETIPHKIEVLLKNNDFIRYFPHKYLYSLHSILQNYLKNRFYHFQPEAYQKQVYRRAGESYAVISQNYLAAVFYYKIRDFDAILSLPFTVECMDIQEAKYQPEFIEKIVYECPEEIWIKYPFAILAFGYYALIEGYIQIYERLSGLLYRAVEDETSFSSEELWRIKGEHAILETLGNFNQVPKMIEGHEKTLQYLNSHSNLVKAGTPWLFAATSVLNMFWRESGTLNEVLQQVDRGAQLYYRFTQGNGAGYNIIMRAEAMLMRGDDDEAEILCYKALYEARSNRQTGMCICAEFIRVRIAILRGDGEGYSEAITNLQGYGKENSDLYILHMIEYCMSVISVVLGVKDYVAPWLYDMERIKKVLHVPMVPFAQMIHLSLLLMDKRYNEFYGVCQLALDQGRDFNERIKYLMPQVYSLIFFSMAKRNSGKYLEAQERLREALDLALPDQVYLPFAQFSGMEECLSEMIVRHVGLENEMNTHAGWGGKIAALKILCIRQQKGVSDIRKAILQKKSPLTSREREVALLAKERLTTKEIAGKLYISPTTVKAILRNVYSKLDIHSKTDLTARDF
ncbi:LuxR C-terminal-related transcriptional regulator [Lacrimispora sp.]|uniref:LuxR C-terminal-related transcriptional regulator n=1 Tax=Lacrimispora sp. TaxID=2719234 RepID=UPI002FD99D1D